ncbi:MAG: SpoIID/LytB domain-containing protein [Candidatus Aminicenantales bacterium]
MHIRHLKYFVITFAILFFFGGRPIEFGKEKTFFHGFVIPNPVIRIGLGTNLRDLVIKSSSGMAVYEVSAGYNLMGSDVEQVRVKGEREILTEKFVLLVAQAKDRKEAESVAEEIRKKAGGNIIVEEAGEAGVGGVFQVKYGEFLTRGDALEAVGRLNALGMNDVWILKENVTVEESRPIWLLIENALRSLGRDSVMYFIPSHPESILSYNGRKYRGIFIIRGTAKGIVLVNVVNIEDYLKGVVPGELSPDLFGAIEALKAQAVAARTYALKNMGQYRSLGYDLNDTPSSQVYGGMDVERPLSSRAVEETRGEVARHKGELINALYMSTCGGMTEDVENVFSGKPVPYLKSTECSYEKTPDWIIEGRRRIHPVLAAGRDAGPGLAPLVSLGVIPFSEDPGFWEGACSMEEALSWIREARRVSGKGNDPVGSESAVLDFRSLSRLLITAFGWQGRVDNLLLPSEVNFVLRDLPEVRGSDRNSLAYCLQMGIFPNPRAEKFLPESAPTRAETAFAISKCMSEYGDLFHEGVFRSLGADGVDLEEESAPRKLRLSSGIFLVRNEDGADVFATGVPMFGGERLRWIEKDGEILFLQVSLAATTSVLDRSSRFNRWRVRKSREDLETAVNQFYPIGRLVDIDVRRRGPSRRVLELLITGTEGQTSARGLRIRSVLGLRDTLFEVDREYDRDGRPTHFVFAGRGWGHGVGMCQVGAYGMAQAGASYAGILKKYYRDIRIEKIY